MQFGTHIRWLFSVEQTRINPFTCNPAKLPCRQALHLKCTISYPCLVSMQHFWDIKPGGNTTEWQQGPHTLCLLVVCLTRSLSLSCFFLLSYLLWLFSSLSSLSWVELKRVSCHLDASAVVSLWRLHSLHYLFWQKHKHALGAAWSGLRE